MRTHRRFRPRHKVFDITRMKKSFLNNVTVRCFMAEIKLSSQVKSKNTKRSDLQHSCTLFQKVQFCAFKSAFVEQFNAKKMPS